MAAEVYLTILDPQGAQKIVALPRGHFTIGSDKSNQIHLADRGLSWRHAILSSLEDGVWLEDLMSHTGTYVEGARVKGRQKVEPGQRMLLGTHALTFQKELAAEPAPAAPAAPAPAAPPASGLPAPVSTAPSVKPPPATAAAEPSQGLSKLAKQKLVVKKQVHEELVNRLDLRRLTVAQTGETELRTKVKEIVAQILHEVRDRLPEGIRAEEVAKEVYDEAVALGPLEDLLADPSVTEVMVNGPHQIYIERSGKLILTQTTFVSESSVAAVIERIVSPIGRRIDESQPYVDARLPDGSRVNAIIHPLSLTGPCITIRKFSKEPLTAEKLIQLGSVTPEMCEFVRAAVMARKNIVVSGGTGTGKTTFLNMVSAYIPTSERILTVEDAAELRLVQPHVIRLEARPPNIEGKGAITIRDLVRNALRMRPDRIVVGECRGGEALDMLQAMNTGHEGSLTTVHANTPRDVISRLETMVLMSGMELPMRAIREQIASAIHMVIHLARFPDGTRKVAKITEVCGLEGEQITMQDLFEFEQKGMTADHKVIGRLRPCGVVPTFYDELKSKGIPLDPSVFTNAGGW